MPPPLPSPLARLPFRIGNDICHIPHVYRLLASSGSGTARGRSRRFVRRVLTPAERRDPRCVAVLKPVFDAWERERDAKGAGAKDNSGGDGAAGGEAVPVKQQQKSESESVDPEIWRAAEFMAGR